MNLLRRVLDDCREAFAVGPLTPQAVKALTALDDLSDNILAYNRERHTADLGIHELLGELERLRRLNESLAARCAAGSEVIAQCTERGEFREWTCPYCGEAVKPLLQYHEPGDCKE